MVSIEEVETVMRSFTNGARMAAPHGAVRQSLEAALAAVHVARVTAGEWVADPERTCPAILTEKILEGDRMQLGCYAAAGLTDEQLRVATVERSRVDDIYLRLRAGGTEWVVEVDYDGAPDGHTSYHVRACGEVGRG